LPKAKEKKIDKEVFLEILRKNKGEASTGQIKKALGLRWYAPVREIGRELQKRGVVSMRKKGVGYVYTLKTAKVVAKTEGPPVTTPEVPSVKTES